MTNNQSTVPNSTDRYLYIFLDEAGNFHFSPKGTKYFLLGCIAKERPFQASHQLNELKYNLVEKGIGLEYFHAAEDQQITRNEVFDIICQNLGGVRYDSVIVEKRKTTPSIQAPEKLYPMILGYLLRYVLNQYQLSNYKEIIVFTDRIPLHKKMKAVEKTIKETLANMLPQSARYRIYHHDSKSNFDLQIADYFNWAVYRKWNLADLRSYRRINSAVASEFDIFKTGSVFHY